MFHEISKVTEEERGDEMTLIIRKKKKRKLKGFKDVFTENCYEKVMRLGKKTLVYQKMLREGNEITEESKKVDTNDFFSSTCLLV